MGIPFTSDTIPLYQTIDGGLTWSPVNLPHPHPAGICSISVVTDSIIFAYGRFFGPAGYLKTTDKGVSWVYKDMTNIALGLIDGHFFNKDTGFITGADTYHKALILSTMDGGASWQPCYRSTRSDSDRVWKIFFPSRNIGYASIEYGGSILPYNTVFLKTTDGGLTWVEHPFITIYDEEGIGFINDSVGWIGGDWQKGNYITHDGGNTWALDSSFGVPSPPYSYNTTGFDINRFRSFGDTLMYASGNTIYKMKIVNSGIKELQNEFYNLDNYPNPYENQTIIKYSLADAVEDLILEVKNVFGQSVFLSHLGYRPKGNGQILFNQKLPVGLYYYSIGSSQFRLNGKMVVR